MLYVINMPSAVRKLLHGVSPACRNFSKAFSDNLKTNQMTYFWLFENSFLNFADPSCKSIKPQIIII